MSKEEALKIFKCWQGYIETGNKLSTLFGVIPEYILPYPAKVLEEALNLMIEDYSSAGNMRMVRNIQELMHTHLLGYIKEMDNDKILEKMRDHLNLLINNPEVKNTVIESLKAEQDSWINLRA